MTSTSNKNWFLLSFLFICGLALGVVFTGCEPAKKTPPVKKTPVKKTPVKNTPVKKTPVKKTPVKKTAEKEKAKTGKEVAKEPSEEELEKELKEEADKIVKEAAEEEPPAPPPVLIQEGEGPEGGAKPPEEPAPAAGAISSFAPAEDLAAQVPDYIKKLGTALEKEEDFEDSQGAIGKKANTLILISLGLGLHDQDNKYKANARAMVKAAQQLAAAKDYAAATAAFAAFQKAAGGEGTAEGELKWEKVAALSELMGQVPLINSKLNMNIEKRFSRKVEDNRGMSAVIAIIAHGSMANASETEKPDKEAQWKEFCIQMRDAAGTVNAKIRAGDEEAAGKAMDALKKSCDDCHAVFHEEESK